MSKHKKRRIEIAAASFLLFALIYKLSTTIAVTEVGYEWAAANDRAERLKGLHAELLLDYSVTTKRENILQLAAERLQMLPAGKSQISYIQE